MSEWRHILISALFVAVAFSLFSCSEPQSYEEFVRTGSKDEDGLYRFTLNMSDSLAVYDLSFYSRIECGNGKLAELRDFPLDITLQSPSGRKYWEKVYFPVHQSSKGSNFYSHQYILPYRSGIIPDEAGEWELAVRIDADGHIPGFRGLGVILEKKEWDIRN